MSKKITLFFPKRTIAISLTGAYCSLNCAHCGGYYLRSMKPPGKAEDIIKNYDSALISGGCKPDGSVPLLENLSFIDRIKRKNLQLNFHTGLIDENCIRKIKPYVDTISFDFVVDDETIEEVYGFPATGKDYLRTYRLLRENFKVVPHINIGLLGGELKGERKALQMLREAGAEKIVFLVFIPTRGTIYEKRNPPPLDKTKEIFEFARTLFPEIPLHLGCMHPRGEYKKVLERIAIDAGFDGIVNPTKNIQDEIRKRGLLIEEGLECCVL